MPPPWGIGVRVLPALLRGQPLSQGDDSSAEVAEALSERG